MLKQKHIQPDIEGAIDYALQRLRNEISPLLFYHNLAHTKDDVLPAIEQLAVLEGINSEDLMLLRTAACYHDLGFIEQRIGHEEISIAIAQSVLPRFGYQTDQINIISNLIAATKMPQSLHTHLEQIIADADLDTLGRTDFIIGSHALHKELTAAGELIDLRDWYQRQIAFLTSHCYFTPAAHDLRDQQKQQNIVLLEQLVSSL